MSFTLSGPLPDVSLQPGHTITVTIDDPAAVITELNVFALNLDTGQIEEVPFEPPLYAFQLVQDEAAA